MDDVKMILEALRNLDQRMARMELSLDKHMESEESILREQEERIRKLEQHKADTDQIKEQESRIRELEARIREDRVKTKTALAIVGALAGAPGIVLALARLAGA